LPCVAMTAATSPGNKNLSAPLKAYDTTIVYVVCTWSKCYVAHDCRV
jgi:hypothetical protein